MWDCDSFSTPQVDNKEMKESQAKQKLDFLCTPACPLEKLQIITYNFTYRRRNDEIQHLASKVCTILIYQKQFPRPLSPVKRDSWHGWQQVAVSKEQANTSLSSTKFKHAFKYLVSL